MCGAAGSWTCSWARSDDHDRGRVAEMHRPDVDARVPAPFDASRPAKGGPSPVGRFLFTRLRLLFTRLRPEGRSIRLRLFMPWPIETRRGGMLAVPGVREVL